MSPRIEKYALCPHCKVELRGPTPRVCPACGGSLQKRFLKWGCLTSAPPILLAAAALAFGASRSEGSGGYESSRGSEGSGGSGVAEPPQRPAAGPSEPTPSLQWPPPPSR